MANFHVRGKTFATYAINHHGDGRVALWLQAQTIRLSIASSWHRLYWIVAYLPMSPLSAPGMSAGNTTNLALSESANSCSELIYFSPNR